MATKKTTPKKSTAKSSGKATADSKKEKKNSKPQKETPLPPDVTPAPVETNAPTDQQTPTADNVNTGTDSLQKDLTKITDDNDPLKGQPTNNGAGAGNTDIPAEEDLTDNNTGTAASTEQITKPVIENSSSEEEITEEVDEVVENKWLPGKRNPLTGMFTGEEREYIEIHLNARMQATNPLTGKPYSANAQHFIRQCVNFCVNFQPGQTFGRANVERFEFE